MWKSRLVWPIASILLFAFAASAFVGERIERQLGGARLVLRDVVATIGEVQKSISPESHVQLVENRVMLDGSLRKILGGQLLRLEKLLLDAPAGSLGTWNLGVSEQPIIAEIYRATVGQSLIAKQAVPNPDSSFKPAVVTATTPGSVYSIDLDKANYSKLEMSMMISGLARQLNRDVDQLLLLLEQYSSVNARARAQHINSIGQSRGSVLIRLGILTTLIGGIEKMAASE